jgi:hypothetical protein
MNWKFMVAAISGLLAGLSIAPFEQRVVIASAAPTNTHFQMQDATVDESNGEGQNVPTHEVFLLDTESGKVWRFQGLVWSRDKDGSAKMIVEPKFFSVAVEPPK